MTIKKRLNDGLKKSLVETFFLTFYNFKECESEKENEGRVLFLSFSLPYLII